MARVYRYPKRPKTWGVDYLDPTTGKRHRRVVGPKAQADRVCAEMTERERLAEFGMQAAPTLAVLVDLVLAHHERRGKRSIISDRGRYRVILEILGAETSIARIRSLEIERLASELGGRGLSRSTVNRYLQALGYALRFAEAREMGIMRAPKIELAPEPPARDRLWTEEEYQAVLSWCVKDRERLAMKLSRHCALRLSEVCSLTWDRVFLDADVPWLRVSSKAKNETSANRPIPILDRDLVNDLRSLRKPSGFVCVGPKGGQWNAMSAAARMAGIRKKVGVEATHHDLRRTRLTEVFQLGGGAETIAPYAGHASFQTSRRYVHPTAADLAARITTHPPPARRTGRNDGPGRSTPPNSKKGGTH